MDIICAKCNSLFVHAVQPAGTMDRMLRRFRIYPFRCQVCRTRFRRMHLNKPARPEAADQQEYRRRPVSLSATLLSEEWKATGTVTDLSPGGCSIRTSMPLQEGAMMSVVLHAFDGESPIGVETAIVRRADARGGDLDFLQFVRGDGDRLDQFMLTLWIDGTQIARKGHLQNHPAC